MSAYAFPARPSGKPRPSLLALVVAGHLGVGLFIFTARSILPAQQEMPLFVDFISSEIPKPEPIRPQPTVKPQARPEPIARNITPTPETTRSELNANVAVPTESKPTSSATNAPVAEPVISQPRFDADYLRNPAPAYPLISRRQGESGKVVLRVLVNPQGSPEVVEIKTSSGSPRLDESAQKTLRQWKFVPAKHGDLAVQSWVLVPIIFKLEQ